MDDLDVLNNLDSDDVMLLQQILATDTGTLSAVELAALRGEDVDAVRGRLKRLADEDMQLVTRVEAVQPVAEDVPPRYYAVTEYGVNILQEIGMYDQIGILYDMYRAAQNPQTPEGWAEMDTIREVRPSANWIVNG